jgi:uncharacterized cupredoxin-like copper-binding protein
MTRYLVARAVVAASLGLLAAGLAGCGSRSDAGAPAGSTQVTMVDYRFTPSTLQAKVGSVTFFLINTGTQPHDMVITDASGKVVAKSEIVQPGNSSVVKVDALKAGSYEISCDLPGHKQSGMVTKLDVS